MRRQRACEICDVIYRPTYGEQRTCGRACGVELRRHEGSYTENGDFCDACGRQAGPHSHVAFVNCPICKKLFATRGKRLSCSAECARVRMNRQVSDSIMARYHSDPAFRDQMIAAAHLRRADRVGVDVGHDVRTKRDLIAYLLKRDHGRCGICRKPVRAKAGAMRPSVDHIVPLTKGGAHELANLQLAHYRCNLSKNNRGGGEQLLLVG